MKLIVAILSMLIFLGGCAERKSFKIGVVNSSTRLMEGTTVEYVNGRAPAGWLVPGKSGVADAAPPKGPIRMTWNDGQGTRYSVQIPIRREYIIQPEGILVLQVLPDRTVSAHAVPFRDIWSPAFYERGDIFTPTIVLSAQSK